MGELPKLLDAPEEGNGDAICVDGAEVGDT